METTRFFELLRVHGVLLVDQLARATALPADFWRDPLRSPTSSWAHCPPHVAFRVRRPLWDDPWLLATVDDLPLISLDIYKG